MSDQLQYSRIVPYFNMLRESVRAEIPNQCERFGFPPDVDKWEKDMNRVNYFLLTLNERMQTELHEFYEQYNDGVKDGLVSFQCYPNPSSGEIYLSFDADVFSITGIDIYDLMGRKVLTIPCMIIEGKNDIVINPNLTAGIYLLRVGSCVQRIVRF